MNNILYLVLENGKIFKGYGFGAEGEIIGETVFTTSMTGYNETITDPSYCGQLVVQTFPLIGNYGIIPEDFESRKPFLKGYIIKDLCREPSNFRCAETLEKYFEDNGIIGMYGIDTRELTRILREKGTMNGKLTRDISDVDSIINELKGYSVKNAVEQVSCDSVRTYKADNAKYNVVLWDFGAKANILRELLKRGCNVIKVPHSTTCEEILKLKPDGVMLSNGPGDPSDNADIIAELKKLSDKQVPIFGICLGHQLLALSQGAKTTKLKYGHRGANQPVKDLKAGRVFISSQNHGYAVVSDSIPANASIGFVNVNDGTCEGVSYSDRPAFSVQFHPEACSGPHDTNPLFDRFINYMKGAK